MDTEPYPVIAGLLIRKALGGHMVDSVSLIRNVYEYGRWSRDIFRIQPAIVAICL